MSIRMADKNTFKSMIAGDFAVVDFYGTTCAPCKLFSKILEDLEAEIPFLDIVKLNVTENPEVAREYGISAVPTVHFYKNGALVASHVGVMRAEEIKSVVAQYLYA